MPIIGSFGAGSGVVAGGFGGKQLEATELVDLQVDQEVLEQHLR
jgi:hypothetical protein